MVFADRMKPDWNTEVIGIRKLEPHSLPAQECSLIKCSLGTDDPFS